MKQIPTKSKIRGYTILEVLVVVGVIGVVTGIALTSVGSRPGEPANLAKLESDVATIDRAVAHYLAFGGDLRDVKDAMGSG